MKFYLFIFGLEKLLQIVPCTIELSQAKPSQAKSSRAELKQIGWRFHEMAEKHLEAHCIHIYKHTNNNDASAIRLDARHHRTPRHKWTCTNEQTNKPTHAYHTHLIAMIINILNLLELQFDVSLYSSHASTVRLSAKMQHDKIKWREYEELEKQLEHRKTDGRSTNTDKPFFHFLGVSVWHFSRVYFKAENVSECISHNSQSNRTGTTITKQWKLNVDSFRWIVLRWLRLRFGRLKKSETL